VTMEDQEVLLGNEIYASLQSILNKINIHLNPSEILVNRRVNQSAQTVIAKSIYSDLAMPVVALPLLAGFEKGAGDIFPTYKTNESGQTKILLNKIGSKDLEQTIEVKVDIDALSGSAASPIYTLVAKTLRLPSANVVLKVQRPIVYLTSEEKSFGYSKSNDQITNKLKNLLANNG
jgi:hypothetical protein